jgi:hypothetical protein
MQKMWHALFWGKRKIFHAGQGLVSIGVQSLAMMLTSLLPAVMLVLAITVF